MNRLVSLLVIAYAEELRERGKLVALAALRRLCDKLLELDLSDERSSNITVSRERLELMRKIVEANDDGHVTLERLRRFVGDEDDDGECVTLEDAELRAIFGAEDEDY